MCKEYKKIKGGTEGNGRKCFDYPRPHAYKNARHRPLRLRKAAILQRQTGFLNWLEFSLSLGDYDQKLPYHCLAHAAA
jgi:hypothetical protein